MSILNPVVAAQIAAKVYEVQVDDRWNDVVKEGSEVVNTTLGILNDFSLDGSAGRFHGTSGGNILRSKTGFGYIASGVGTRSQEILIATRGTVTAYDWVTDALQGLRIGPGGYPVHAGFQNTFDSFKPTISNFITNSRNKPTTVHLVGHSLGGALATLGADYLSELGLNVKLYTFGCPRTGVEEFSRHLTRKLKPENIFRVHHASDPVAMVPIYPFFHAAMDRSGFTLPWDGMPVSFAAHKMGNYIKSIGEESNWVGLKRCAPSTWTKAETWLEQASQNGHAVKMYSAKSLWMIMKCMEWIMSDVIGRFIGLEALGFVTVVDVMTKVLYEGTMASIKVAGYVEKLMVSILKFLGRTAIKGMSLTTSFIKWVLDLLFNFISTAAQLALQRLI